MSITIYHNPRCSKSRQTKQILDERNLDAEVVEYLKTPPDSATLKSLLSKLGIPARELLRTHETEYKETGLDNLELSEEQIIDTMIKHPILIERPIVVSGNKAIIGRPPEKILDILE